MISLYCPKRFNCIWVVRNRFIANLANLAIYHFPQITWPNGSALPLSSVKHGCKQPWKQLIQLLLPQRVQMLRTLLPREDHP
jgi:hypothetical protein